MNKQNHWVAMEYVHYATWSIVFENLGLSVSNLMNFVSKMTSASQRYQIAEPKALTGHFFKKIPNYIERPEYSYMDYIQEIVQQFGVFHFYKATSATFKSNSVASKISYYDQEGNVQTQSTDNAGQILRQVYGETLTEEQAKEYAADVPPVNMRCGFLDVEQDRIKNDFFVLHISLHSDIWFPKIYGFRDEEGSTYRIHRELPLDNSELANLHTSRLNQFLADVRQEALDIGAIWELDPDSAPVMEDQVTEMGIILD